MNVDCWPARRAAPPPDRCRLGVAAMNGTSSVGRPGRPKRLCRGATRFVRDIHRHRPPSRYVPPFQACKQAVAVRPMKRRPALHTGGQAVCGLRPSRCGGAQGAMQLRPSAGELDRSGGLASPRCRLRPRGYLTARARKRPVPRLPARVLPPWCRGGDPATGGSQLAAASRTARAR